MIVLYPNLCYKEVGYKGTALYGSVKGTSLQHGSTRSVWLYVKLNSYDVGISPRRDAFCNSENVWGNFLFQISAST